ncbi:MAG: alpha/beta-type small acid-soluble spore protein [Clostridia bacterium]|nr:alpha/beta-type small acid-soluble spore protein [Clostridia bacterium]
MNSTNNTSGSSNGSNSSRRNKSRLQQFKNEVASSMNVDLKQGYNGDLTSREAGSVGGEMVKRMIAYAEQNME